MAYKAQRPGVAARLPAPAGQQSIAVALALLDHSDPLLMDLELPSVHTAQPHAAHTLYRLPPVPGLGKMFSRVLLSAIHAMDRLPRVQACASYCRRVQCAKEAASTRSGTSGPKIGQA